MLGLKVNHVSKMGYCQYCSVSETTLKTVGELFTKIHRDPEIKVKTQKKKKNVFITNFSKERIYKLGSLGSTTLTFKICHSYYNRIDRWHALMDSGWSYDPKGIYLATVGGPRSSSNNWKLCQWNYGKSSKRSRVRATNLIRWRHIKYTMI